jgi:hypothetical protein
MWSQAPDRFNRHNAGTATLVAPESPTIICRAPPKPPASIRGSTTRTRASGHPGYRSLAGLGPGEDDHVVRSIDFSHQWREKFVLWSIAGAGIADIDRHLAELGEN